MLHCRRRLLRNTPLVPLLTLLAMCGALATSTPAWSRPAAAPVRAESRKALPGGIELVADRIEENTQEGRVILEGSVTLTWQGARIQADRLTVTARRWVEAEGHVLLVWLDNRIAGTRLTYDLEEDRGTIENAIGQVQSEFVFWAKRAEKIGADKVHLESATVTTCTQPVPYWSFSVSSANIRVDRYAHMLNVRLKTGNFPVLYLPYLIWPVKQDRAFGLLLPEIRTTRLRGRVISQELFIPIGRSADLTLLGRFYTEAGFGAGGTLRVIPNAQGRAELTGFYIRDELAGSTGVPDCPLDKPCGRYRATYRQTQNFRNGFRMVADINLVSDFSYFNDFERELNLVSSPTILARLEFSRNGRWTSLNVREMRREQLFSGGVALVQQTFPEIEWRGRSRRLGKTPLYLSFESSAASIQQRGRQQNAPIDADYLRGDFFPELSAPISPVPWLDITPRVSSRITHYTQQQRLFTDPDNRQQREVLDRGVTRTLFGAGLEIVGPKFFRIYDTPNSRFSKRYKHTFEPNLSYGFLETFERLEDLLIFDEVDRFNGSGASMAYGIRSRLFAKRPRSTAPSRGAGATPIILPGESPAPAEPGSDPDAAAGTPKGPAEGEPVEIATLELRQSRSFERDLSIADVDGDGMIQDDESTPYSPIQLFGRFNPSHALSLDVRSTYDILFDRVSDVAVSGMLRKQLARVRVSLVHREGLLAGTRDDTQVRLGTGLSLFRNKLQVNLEGSYDANPAEGQARIPDRRWRVTYATQCCTFLVEKLNRNFSALEPRRDIYFRIDLRGVGKLLDTSF